MASMLIIDDDSSVRLALRELLVREGHKVIEANNGVEAIKAYKNKRTDLVITDIVMPEKEGIETIVELKRINPDIKIIAISGGGDNDSTSTYLAIAEKLGAACSLEKPLKKTKLLECIRNIESSLK